MIVSEIAKDRGSVERGNTHSVTKRFIHVFPNPESCSTPGSHY